MENSFDEEPQDQSVYARDTAMFACDIGGAPKPTVRWYKDEVEVEGGNSNYVIHGGGVLEIRSVQPADLGRYKCRVENIDKSRISNWAVLRFNSDTCKLTALSNEHFVIIACGSHFCHHKLYADH